MEKEIIKIRKKDCEPKKTIKLSGDILVPDTKPDIINITGINGMCFIKKEEISEGKIRIDGNWNGNVIYLSDIGEIKSLNTNFDFLESIENDKIKSKDEIEYSYKILNTEARILNERKINLEVTVEYTIKDYKIEEIEIISNFEEGNDIQKLERNVVSKKFLNYNFTKTSINEDVNFSETGKNIEILKRDLFVANIEKKISYNKVLAKADANINILYLCDNQVKKFECKIPIMSFIEIENVKEENIIDLNYNTRKFIITNNVSEKNSINCDLEFEISCNVYDKKEFKVVEDLYSLEKDVKFSTQDVNMECICDMPNEFFEFNEKIGIEEIKEVYDYNYCLKKIEKSNGNNYEGVLGLEIYYCKEENNSLIQKNIEFPFIINNMSDDYEFKIDKCEVKSVNEEYVCNFKITCIKNIRYENVSVLKECELVECSSNDNYSMIIYYVKPNDTIWKIAKAFKVSMDSLIELNNLVNPDKIMPGEKLYIMRG